MNDHATVARIEREATFHDHWAEETNIVNIDVRRCNEAITAPEMRYIIRRLGALTGKKLLDAGCGLGEASVYFALQGAAVTSLDLSEQMLAATRALAARYQTTVTTRRSSAEELLVADGEQFDIVYAGNLLHHVDIPQTLAAMASVVKRDGTLVTWDPMAYNPLINVYRRLAWKVRTPDEHPLKLRDIRLFSRYFQQVEVRYFWLFTLLIFILMTVFQRRNPNKERFWKVVIDEGETWAWLYAPLEKLDRLILKRFPWLGIFCWNVVIIAKEPDMPNPA